MAANQARLLTLAAVFVIVAGLRLGREVLIPLALSILLAFLLTPLVRRLERWRFPRVPAVMLVSAFGFAVIALLGYVLVRQGLDLTAKLPEYRQNIVEKVRTLQPSGDDPISRAIETIEDIEKEVRDEPGGRTAESATGADPAPAPQEPAPPPDEPRRQAEPEEPPVPVELVERTSFVEQVSATAGPLLGPLANAAVVIVLVIFVLLAREDLRDRVVHLLGSSEVHVTTQALEDAGRRVSRYLLMQLIVNTIYAVPVGVGLWLLGVPNAALWAVLGLALRFVPYVGPLIAAGMPILLSLAHFEGWSTPLAVAGMYVVIELIVNNVVEPWLYGSSTGMSSVAVIVSAVFWTWLWGPIGLLMATPLTATLVAFGRHMPGLGPLSSMLGDAPVGEPEMRFYQRLLALDDEGALDIADEQLTACGSVVEVFDDMILPSLHRAHEARQHGALPEERYALLEESLEAVADSLIERGDPAPEDVDEAAVAIDRERERSLARAAVLCMPARDESDHVLAEAFAALLVSRGYRAAATEPGLLVSDRVAAVAEFEPDVVVISALPPTASAHARHLGKRLRARDPELCIVVGAWGADGDDGRIRPRTGMSGPGRIVRTFAAALQEIEERSRGLPPPQNGAPAAAAGSVERSA